MKTTLVGLLLALLLAVYHVNGGKIPSFNKEKVYIYDYEGRVATGINEKEVKHFSGFGTKAHLKVYTKDDKVYFKFEDAALGLVNRKVDDFFEALHIDYAKPDNEKMKKVVAEIEKPFAAVYEDGVFKLFYDPDDSQTNWRRAVIGLFQTQFHPTGAHNPDFYKIYEDGVGGDCKTLYYIDHIPSEDTNIEEVMNVTKVRFYDDCKTRPHYFFSNLDGEKCNECNEETTKALKTFGRVEYEIRGTKQHFTIEKVHASGAVSFTPFTTNGQTVISVVNQTLSLVSEEEDANPFEIDVQHYTEIKSLSYQFYPDTVKDVHDEKNLYYNRIYKQPTVEDPVAQLLPKLTTMAKDYKAAGKESSSLLYILYDLYLFEYKHYVELFDKHLNRGADTTEEEKTIKAVLLQLLPYVGTNAAIKYMFELIEHLAVDENTASNMVSVFPHYAKELLHETIEILQTFLAKDPVKDILKIWNTGILAFGTLVHKACVHDSMQPHIIKDDVDNERCAGYVKMLKDKFYEAAPKSHTDATGYFKALLNSRHPDGFDLYIDILQNKTKYHRFFIMNAMWGAAYFAEENSEKTVALIAPLYFDPRNDHVVRINAFEVMMFFFGKPEFYSSLILSLEKEPNEKVASHIISYLTTLANTTDPCYKKYNEKARYVLQFVKPPKDYDVFRHSHTHIFSAYNEKYNFGRRLQYGYIPSDHSIVPSEIFIEESFNMMGYDFPLIEFGLLTDEDNPMTHAAATFGPRGLRKRYDHEHSKQIQDIISKLHLDSDRPHAHDAKYQIYASLFGHDAKFTNQFDSHESNELTVHATKMTFEVHRINVIEAEYYVPNEMGFPVVLTLKIPATVHLSGSNTLHPRPSKGLGVMFDVNAHLGLEFLVKARMFVYTPSLSKFGYELNTKGGIEIPIKGSLDMDTHTKKFALKSVQPIEPYDIFHYETTPISFDPKERIPIKYSDHHINKEYRFGHDYLGVGLKSNFQYDYTWNDYGSYREFLKSFFHKYSRHEDYFDLADKYFAGTRGISDYAFINPTAKPFRFHIKYEPSETNPTTEFLITHKYNHTTYFDQDKGHDTCTSSISIIGHGPTERKWDGEISVSKTYPEEDVRKVAIHLERSPIPNYDEEKLELHYKSDVTYVNYLSIFTDKPEEVTVNYNGKLTIGNEEDHPKEISVKMVAEQTDEHKNADKSKIWFYKKCMEEAEKYQAEFTDACWRVMKDSGRIDKITFDFDLKNIPHEYKGFAYRLYSYFRHAFYNNLYIDHFHGSNEDNHIKVVANFSYHYPVFDLKIVRPDQTVYYNKIYAPAAFPKYEPFTIAEDAKDRFKRNYFGYEQAMCFLTGNRIHTFDGLEYTFDKDGSKCYHLVMGDCQNKNFLAFAKKVETPKLDKAMKFYFHDDVIEVLPNKDGDELEIFVNGEKKERTKGFFFHITDRPYFKLTISYWGKSVYIVAPDYGVELYTDGRNGGYMPNNFFKGKQCGLCGDLNGELHHELQKPDGTLIKSYPEVNRYYRYSKDGEGTC